MRKNNMVNRMTGMAMALVLPVCAGIPGTVLADEEKKELNVLIWDFGYSTALPYDDNYWFDYIQKNFGDPNNIQVNFVSMNRNDETTMLNVWMASGEAPDIIYTYDINLVQNYLKQGGLADLTDAVENYGSHLIDYIGEENQSVGNIDGRQMFLVGNRAVDIGIVGSVIRGDWLDELGLEVPTTTEEFYEVMTAFKEKDPGNVGENLIPWAMSMQEISFGYFNTLYSFVDPDLTEKEMATIYPFNYPGYEDGVRFVNKCFNEGLISPEFALDTDSTKMWSDVVNGYVGFLTANVCSGFSTGSYYDQMKENVPGAYYVACDPFTNSKGEHTKLGNNPWDKYIMVPASSDAVDEAIKYMDWIASDEEIMLNLMYGAEGEDKGWYRNEEGLIIANDDYMGEDRDVTGVTNQSLVFFSNGFDYGDEELNTKAQTISYNDPQAAIQYEQALTDRRSDPWFFPVWPQAIESEAEYSGAMAEKYKEIFTRLYMCTPDQFDAMYEEQVGEFMDLYGTEVCEERNAVWEQYYGDAQER